MKQVVIFAMDVGDVESVEKGLFIVNSHLPLKGDSSGYNNQELKLNYSFYNLGLLYAVIHGATEVVLGMNNWLTVDDYYTVLRTNVLGVINVTNAFKFLLMRARSSLYRYSPDRTN